MNRTAIGGSAAGVLVLSAFLLRTPILSPPPQSTRAPAHTGVSQRPSHLSGSQKTLSHRKRPEDGPWNASQEHFAGVWRDGKCPPAKTSPAKKDVTSLGGATLGSQQPTQEGSIENPWCIPKGTPVHAMIAIAPDPVHSHLALGFDRTVEAVQLAAQSVNYVGDRYWLPWDISPKPDWTDYASFDKATKEQDQKERQPGLLLFRWNGALLPTKRVAAQRDQEKLGILYVFLVADTSTAGINGEQFSNAVTYIQEIYASAGENAASAPIQVMGPTFSGSLASLRLLVEANKEHTFVVSSGTVSSLCVQRDQHLLNDPDSLAQAAWLCDQDATFKEEWDLPLSSEYERTFEDLCSPLRRQRWSSSQAPSPKAVKLCHYYEDYNSTERLTFRSFASSSELAIAKFIKTLETDRTIQCGTLPEVALLSESTTTYGTALASRHDCYTSFAYPREIASLRNASQGTAAAQRAAGSSNGGAASVYLPLNLADEVNRSDEPPDFSISQGPLSKEAVLMNFATELRRDHYKYIGITGTNVLDVLFLTTFLRTAVPDARLFLFDSDLLLERDLDNAPYIGTLAITTYPLVPRDLDWTSLGAPRLPFADEREEGQFNATLFAIEKLLKTTQGNLYECGAQPCPQGLPLWLTAVGTGGYWPVQMLFDRAQTSKNAKLILSDFSGGWTVVSVFLCVLGFLHSGVLLRAWLLSAVFRDFSLLNAEPGQKLFFIHTASASLVTALSMMGIPVWTSTLHMGIGTALKVAIVGLLLACLLLELNYILRWALDKGDEGRAPGGSFVLQVISSVAIWTVALLLILMWASLFDGTTSYGVFFAFRSLHLATGVSPLMPMLPLIAAIYLWSIGEVWRLRFNEQIRPRLSPSGNNTQSADTTSRFQPGVLTETPVAKAINRYLLSPAYIVCFVLILTVWFWFFDPRHAFELFERKNFDTLYEILFGLVVAFILSSGFRMAEVWLELKKLLQELDRGPVRFVFRSQKDLGWSSLWHRGSEDAEWKYAVRSLEIVEKLARSPSDTVMSLRVPAARLLDVIQDIQESRKTLQKTPVVLPAVRAILEYVGLIKSKTLVRECQRLLASVRQMQDLMADILRKALHILNKVWQNQFSEPKDADDDQRTNQPPLVLYCEKEDDNPQRRLVTYRYQEETDLEAEQQKLLGRYVALRYFAFIRAVLSRIRFMVVFLAIAFSLLLISLNVYSFEPHQALIWSLTAIFCVIGFIVVVVLMQVHRDPILSSITGTQANELGLDFYIRIVSLGAIPLLTLLSTHFPAIGHSLVSFLQPGLEALK